MNEHADSRVAAADAERDTEQGKSTSGELSTADIAGYHAQPAAETSAQPPTDQAARSDAVGGQDAAKQTPLFNEDATKGFRSRWDGLQAGFVDDPRQAVQQADSLVAEVMKRLAEVFADERSKLDQQWEHGGDVSTEDLRIALQRYRSFFSRLLSF